jgi:hypothetical protein
MGRCCRRQDRRNDRQHLSRRLDAAASVFLTYPAGSVAQFLRPWWNHGNSHARNGDGVTFAQAVKAEFPAVPIILVSGQAEPHPEFGFIRKPFQPSALLNAVREVVAGNLTTVPADC